MNSHTWFHNLILKASQKTTWKCAERAKPQAIINHQDFFLNLSGLNLFIKTYVQPLILFKDSTFSSVWVKRRNGAAIVQAKMHARVLDLL